MMLGTQAITVIRQTTPVEDEYHNVVSWNEERHDIAGCSVQPNGAGAVVVDRREATTTLFLVYAPAGSDVLDTDDVEYAGQRYSVDGSVQRWSVGSILDHLVIPLKNVTG